MKKLRLVLADDHALVRAGIRLLIEDLPDVDVVAEASDGPEALRVIQETQPDVALLDLSMPGMNGLTITEKLAATLPKIKVIILSMHRGTEFVTYALRAGAAGYIVKDAATNELGLAIHAVARGGSYLSPAISRAVIAKLGQGRSSGEPEELTTRQREVLRLVAEGLSMKEIASKLGLSVKTVEAHRAQMTERLGIHDVPGLVRYAMRTGLVRPEPPSETPREFP